MEAVKMFKKLGYTKTEDDFAINYDKGADGISFYKDGDKTFAKYIFDIDKEFCVEGFISPKELKAILKQLEELGWI